MPPLEWNGFAGPVISIIILTTSVMNFTGLPWELLVEIMVSHFSAMKRFSLYEGLRRQQSPHYFINLPKYVQACDAELGVTGQVRWHWGFAALVSPRTFFFFSPDAEAPFSMFLKSRVFNKDFFPQSPWYSKNRDIHVKYFKSFTKVLRFPNVKWAEWGRGWQNYQLPAVIQRLSVTHSRHSGEEAGLIQRLSGCIRKHHLELSIYFP